MTEKDLSRLGFSKANIRSENTSYYFLNIGDILLISNTTDEEVLRVNFDGAKYPTFTDASILEQLLACLRNGK
jgi:hypothetical protein